MKLLKIIVVLVVCSIGAGCVRTRTYIGSEPTDPIPGMYYLAEMFMPVVNNAQPRLKWDAIEVDDVSYDIGIWEVSSGELIYYRENILRNSHKLEETLNLNTVYLWSVRFRVEGLTSDWSGYKETIITSFNTTRYRDVKFSFKTPTKIKKEKVEIRNKDQNIIIAQPVGIVRKAILKFLVLNRAAIDRVENHYISAFINSTRESWLGRHGESIDIWITPLNSGDVMVNVDSFSVGNFGESKSYKKVIQELREQYLQ